MMAPFIYLLAICIVYCLCNYCFKKKSVLLFDILKAIYDHYLTSDEVFNEEMCVNINIMTIYWPFYYSRLVIYVIVLNLRYVDPRLQEFFKKKKLTTKGEKYINHAALNLDNTFQRLDIKQRPCYTRTHFVSQYKLHH